MCLKNVFYGVLIGSLITSQSGCRTRPETATANSDTSSVTEENAEAKAAEYQKQAEAKLNEQMPGWSKKIKKNGKLVAVTDQEIIASKITDLYFVPPANMATTLPVVQTKAAYTETGMNLGLTLLNEKMVAKARGTLLVDSNDGRSDAERKIANEQIMKNIFNQYNGVKTTSVNGKAAALWNLLVPTAHAQINNNKHAEDVAQCKIFVTVMYTLVATAALIFLAGRPQSKKRGFAVTFVAFATASLYFNQEKNLKEVCGQ